MLASLGALTVAHTFLPYGEAVAAPAALHADTILCVRSTSSFDKARIDGRVPVIVAASEAVDGAGTRLVAVRGVSTWLDPADVVCTLPVDAGPFASRSEAAALCRRWLREYWECHRSGVDTNSCFEFGGCHRRCWWRASSTGRVDFHLTELGAPSATARDDDHDDVEAPGEALAYLRRRAGADLRRRGGSRDRPTVAAGAARRAPPPPLALHATLASLAPGMHYVGLRPLEAGGPPSSTTST